MKWFYFRELYVCCKVDLCHLLTNLRQNLCFGFEMAKFLTRGISNGIWMIAGMPVCKATIINGLISGWWHSLWSTTRSCIWTGSMSIGIMTETSGTRPIWWWSPREVTKLFYYLRTFICEDRNRSSSSLVWIDTAEQSNIFWWHLHQSIRISEHLVSKSTFTFHIQIESKKCFQRKKKKTVMINDSESIREQIAEIGRNWLDVTGLVKQELYEMCWNRQEAHFAWQFIWALWFFLLGNRGEWRIKEVRG